jgi:glutathione synthase/RimK-type ligase-like ATP-grasp enzyme
MRIGIASSEEVLPVGDRRLVDALVAIGFEVEVVDWKDAAREWSGFDAVVVRSCWDYHLQVEKFLQWIGRLESCGVVVVNSPELIRWNASKTYLGELAAGGAVIPETIFVDAGQEIDLGEVCAARGWREAVVKPVVSASAHRTERRNSGIVRGPAIVQRFIEAIESEGEWSLVFIGGEYSHAVNKKPAAEDFRVQVEHGGTVIAGEAPAIALPFAARVLKLLPWPAVFARVDVVVDRGRIWLMELEVIEPELYLEMQEGAAGRLAALILRYLETEAQSQSPHP